MSTPEYQGTSNRPYLLRALHDWCTDNGFTPYIAVHVDASVQVPREYVKNDEIVLNIGFEATSGLKLGNEFVEFRARFGGVAREIVVPVDHVVAIYARENGQGMAFPMPVDAAAGGRSAGAQGEAGASASTSLAGASAPRGLRLASPESPGSPESLESVDLSGAPAVGSKASPGDGAGAGADDGEPPDPSTPGGGRPALKRVK